MEKNFNLVLVGRYGKNDQEICPKLSHLPTNEAFESKESWITYALTHPNMVWNDISMDFITDLPTTLKGNPSLW